MRLVFTPPFSRPVCVWPEGALKRAEQQIFLNRAHIPELCLKKKEREKTPGWEKTTGHRNADSTRVSVNCSLYLTLEK